MGKILTNQMVHYLLVKLLVKWSIILLIKNITLVINVKRKL
jgi:hypothetical protein